VSDQLVGGIAIRRSEDQSCPEGKKQKFQRKPNLETNNGLVPNFSRRGKSWHSPSVREMENI
jgi:hypothetical protein